MASSFPVSRPCANSLPAHIYSNFPGILASIHFEKRVTCI
jgi:hypothetical protein